MGKWDRGREIPPPVHGLLPRPTFLRVRFRGTSAVVRSPAHLLRTAHDDRQNPVPHHDPAGEKALWVSPEHACVDGRGTAPYQTLAPQPTVGYDYGQALRISPEQTQDVLQLSTAKSASCASFATTPCATGWRKRPRPLDEYPS